MMQPVTMRFRTDAVLVAELKGLGKSFEDYLGRFGDSELRELWDSTPPAEPGDTWRSTWYGTGNVAGYMICCPQCREVHRWTTANNCASKQPGGSCSHSGLGSCWTWTGEAEQNTLTASPSLHASGACGWHGWLRNGVLSE